MRVALTKGICDSVLAHVNAAYQRRASLLCDILQTESRIHISVLPLGGYFVWISLHGIADTNDFLPYCRDRRVGFLPGSRCGGFVDPSRSVPRQDDDNQTNDFAHQDDNCRKFARLCFADMDESDIVEGAKLFVQCYRDYMDSNQNNSL